MADEPRLRFLNTHERTVFERLYKWWLTGGAAFEAQTAAVDTTPVLAAFNTQIDVDTTAGNITITLPTTNKSIGRRVEVTKIAAANTVTVGSPDLIDGSATIAWTTQWESLTFISRGDTWRIA